MIEFVIALVALIVSIMGLVMCLNYEKPPRPKMTKERCPKCGKPLTTTELMFGCIPCSLKKAKP